MIICEQCGNEFSWGKLITKDNKDYILCPYCKHENRRIYKKRKKKGAKK